MFDCKNVSVWYEGKNESVIKEISLNIPKGFTILCGPNGSGKTTLLRILRGMHKNFGMKVSGEITLNGLNVLDVPPEDLGENIGIVYQRPSSQLFCLTVSDEVRLGPIFFGYKWKEIIEREKEALDKIGISNLKDRIVNNLSGGEQQKTVISAILSIRPKVLLLDEPTSYLDPVSRESVLLTLRDLADSGISILMTSHKIEEEVQYADHMIVLKEGRLALNGTPDEIIFTEEMNDIIPLKGFLKISKQLWKCGTVKEKILNFKKLEEKISLIELENSSTSELINSNSIVEFRNVDVKYPDGTVGLKRCSLRIPDNSVTVILGPNGSGKSTLAKTCLKLLKASSGNIYVKGKDLKKIRANEIPTIFGYLSQDPKEMLFCESSYEEVMFGVKNLNLTHPEERVREALNKMNLLELSQLPPENLSFGQQRRLTIAVTLGMAPQIMFLDEPELAIDSDSLRNLIDILLRLKSEGVGVVILTHDIDNFVPIADHLIIMNEGKVLAEGNPKKILTKEFVERRNMRLPALWNIWEKLPCKTWDELSKVVDVCTGAL